MIEQIDKRVKRFLGQIRLAFRGLGTSVNTEPTVMLIQGVGLSGELIQGAELMQHYGFIGVPPAGFKYIALPVGGKTAHSVIVATVHESFNLPEREEGDSALFDNRGQKVHLTKDGIVIDCSGLPLLLKNAPRVRFETNEFEVTGTIKDRCDTTGETMSGMRDTYNSHTHDDPQGGAVAEPNQQM